MRKVYIPTADEIRLLEKLNLETEKDIVRYYKRTHDERIEHIYRFIMTGSTEITLKYMMLHA